MPEADNQPDLLDVLAEEFTERHRRGEHPSISEYVDRCPELAEQIQALFPSIVLLEQISNQRQSATGGRLGAIGPGLEQLGDYRLLREIGRGGMGIVYEAQQQSLARRVAVKVLPPGLHVHPKLLARFEREAQAAARLHHTNIVPVFGVGQQEGVYYYVMQYIQGQGLDQLVRRLGRGKSPVTTRGKTTDRLAKGPVPSAEGSGPPVEHPSAGGARTVPLHEGRSHKTGGEDPAADAAASSPLPDERSGVPSAPPTAMDLARLVPDSRGAYCRWVAELGSQVADALQHAHEQGTLHRDVKPANLLLDCQGHIWITDFGVAKLAHDDDLTHSGDLVGTLRYMAPEQINGQADARSDVYSLGLTLYELLALRPAFDETSRTRLLRQLAEGHPPPLGRSAEVPRDLETIITKAIAHEPQHRYATAAELAADLRRYLADLPIRARRVGAVERLWRWQRRNRALAAAITSALILLAVAAVVGWGGYVTSSRALHQAQEARELAEGNLGLSLEAFERVFNRVAGRDPVQPLADETEGELLVPGVPSESEVRLLEELLAFYERFAARNLSNQRLQAETARAYRRVGEVQQRLGRLNRTEEAFRRALAIYDQLAATPVAQNYAADRAAVYNGLGLTLQMGGRTEEARREGYQRALDILAGEDSDRARLELIRTHHALGQSLAFAPDRGPGRARSQGSRGTGRERSAEIQSHYRAALELAQGLVQREPKNPDCRLALARSHRLLSASLMRSGSHEEALEHDRQALDGLRQLAAEFPNAPLYRQELVETLTVFRSFWQPQMAGLDLRQRAEEARRLAEALVQDYPRVPEYTFLLAGVMGNLVPFTHGAEAQRYQRRAVDLSRTLVDRFPNVPIYQWRLAWNEGYLARWMGTSGDPKQTRAELEASIHRWEKLSQTSALPRRWSRMMLAGLYRSLAETLSRLGESSKADEARAKAKSLQSTEPRSGDRP